MVTFSRYLPCACVGCHVVDAYSGFGGDGSGWCDRNASMLSVFVDCFVLMNACLDVRHISICVVGRAMALGLDCLCIGDNCQVETHVVRRKGM